MSKKEKGANIPPRRSIIMENFSIVRIAVALFLALSIVFIIIYFVADDPVGDQSLSGRTVPKLAQLFQRD